MAQNGRDLTKKQEKAVVALLAAPTVQAAAEAAGVSERTLWRWLQQPEFKEAYRQARREAVSHAIGRLQQATTRAVETLEEVMGNPEAKESARVSAAKTVLDAALKALELEDLEARVEELERMMAEGDEE